MTGSASKISGGSKGIASQWAAKKRNWTKRDHDEAQEPLKEEGSKPRAEVDAVLEDEIGFGSGSSSCEESNAVRACEYIRSYHCLIWNLKIWNGWAVVERGKCYGEPLSTVGSAVELIE